VEKQYIKKNMESITNREEVQKNGQRYQKTTDRKKSIEIIGTVSIFIIKI
jgi:hypothetical protein